MTLQFFGHPFSSYTQKVLIALWADETPFDYRMVEDPDNMAELKRHSPFGMFPLILDGDRAVFDEIVRVCRSREVPLIVYAQTASAVARHFLGSGVTALSAEPFPFSQFSADPTVLYRYRAAGPAARADTDGPS